MRINFYPEKCLKCKRHLGFQSAANVKRGNNVLQPPSCGLMGARPPNSVIILGIRAYKNHCSVGRAILDLKSCREIALSQDVV